MRAAVFHGREDIRVEEVPAPKPKDDEALVEVEWCGICGFDLHEYTSGKASMPSVITRLAHLCGAGPLVFPQSVPHPLTGETLPCIMGHEFAGVVKSAPKDSGLQLGQKVVADPRLLCDSCHCCRNGLDHCCTKIGFLGYSGRGGGFSDIVPVSAKMLHPVPPNVLLDDAAVVEPLVTAYHAVGAAGVTQWEKNNVLIIGGGPVGLMLLLALRAENVGQILVSEPTQARRKVLLDFADVVVNPIEEDVVEVCRKHTNDRGPDIVYDCAGCRRVYRRHSRPSRLGVPM